MFRFTNKQATALSETIRLAHTDILSTDVWTDILTQVDALVPSDASAAIFFNASTAKPERYANHGFDTAMYDTYEGHFYAREPILSTALSQGTYVWRPEDMVSKSVWHSTEIYNDYLSANGFEHFVTSAVKFGSGVSVWMRMVREDESGPFTDQEVATLRLIQPHLAAAHEKMTRSVQAELVRQAVITSFDRTTTPIFIFDANVRLQHMNHVARDLCASSNEPLDEVVDRVRSASSHLICSETHPFYGKDAGQNTSFQVNGRRYALAMLVIQPPGSQPLFVMYTADVMRHVGIMCQRSMMAYGLSPREIEVCDLLIKGLPNKAIADRFCVTELTIKDHAKSIREKLRVTSRGQILLKLLSH